MTRPKKIFNVTLIISTVFIIFIALLLLWLYSGKLTQAKASVFNTLPLPMAMVNGQFLPMNEFFFRYSVAKKLSNQGLNHIESDTSMRSLIFNQLVEEEEVRQLALRYGAKVSSSEIESEYASRVNAADLEGKKSFDELLRVYGLTSGLYKDHIIKPQALNNSLQIWYNSNEQLNSKSYTQAKNILQRVQAGEDMAVLAKAFSQDESGKATGGDTGFSDPTELLPEMREAVSSMQLNELRILPSRFGLQLVRLEEKSSNKIRLRQIFIQTESYENWFKMETKNFKIKKFVAV